MLAVAAIAVAAVGLTGASGATGGQHSRFQMIAGGPISISSSGPLGLSNKSVTYILQLAARPVAVVDAAHKAAGRGSLSHAQRVAMTRHISSLQAPVVAAVQQIRGATVTARYQGVYNGVSVTLPQREAWRLSSISGVKAVYASREFKMDSAAPGDGVPLVNGPQTWGGTGAYTGTGMKIADIDTGIDYTHADFGGTGTTAAFNCAAAHSADNATDFAANCPGVSNWYSGPKVKGGKDFVGDSYNANPSSPSYQPVPNPDDNPLDCNGHGSHTAGTAAGFGVDHNGVRYTGAYDANTIDNEAFIIPPGVAPNAEIYGLRVFGCSGSVNDDILLLAEDWAFTNNMDVVNMSLGSSFGSPDDPASQAASTLADDGVITVLSSGNSGHAPYMTGSPAAGTHAIATAANDSTASFPGADLSLSTGTNLTGSNGAIVANGAAVTPGTYNVKVLWANSPTNTIISNGCRNTATGANQLPDNSLPANTILVIARGTCARVAKAIFAQQEGAVGAIMVNNSAGFPPYEGPITRDPDAAGAPLWGGFAYTVSIPFFGVKGGSNPSNSANGAALRAADGGTVTVAANSGIANATYLGFASFTSFGPSGGGNEKPEITAPGVSIISAGIGQGNGGAFLSGTSMASPHAAGEALLVKQAHPSWGAVNFWKDAIVNTANPAKVVGFSVRGGGAGEIDAYNATHTRCVAEGSTGTTAISWGVPDSTAHFTETATITLTNFSSTACDFKMSVTHKQGVPHVLTVFSGNSNAPLKVRVPGHGTKTVSVQLEVLKKHAKDAVSRQNDWLGAAQFDDVSGLIHFTALGGNAGIGLNVPYYAVPTLVSNVAVDGISSEALAHGATDGNVVVKNPGGAFGYADWFSWSGTDDTSIADIGSADLLNVGIQSFPSSEIFTGSGPYMMFGLQTTKSWANPAADQFDVYIDVNNDSVPDYLVRSTDFGALQGTTVNGEDVVAVFSLATGAGVINFDTPAMFNGTTMELPVLFDDLCQPSTPCVTDGIAIKYMVQSFDRNGGSDEIGHIDTALEANPGHITSSAARFDVFHPSLLNTFSNAVGRNNVVANPTTIDEAAWNAHPQLGILVLAQNNQNTVGEAYTFSLSF